MLVVHAGECAAEVLGESRAALGGAVVEAVRCTAEGLGAPREEAGVGWRGISQKEDEDGEMEREREAHLDDGCLTCMAGGWGCWL